MHMEYFKMVALRAYIPTLYLAKDRPIVQRDCIWIMVDDERMPLEPHEKPQMLRVRFP